MYSSRGSNTYGQQSYGAQSGYTQNLGTTYSGSSVGGLDGGSQHPLASRHSLILGGSQESDVGGYRGHASSTAHYGSQYGAAYGSAAISGAQQAPTLNAKGSGVLSLDGRGTYPSTLPESPKFSSADYISSSSHGYGHKSDQLFTEKIPDYPAIDRRTYGERQGAYMGRDMQGDTAPRYVDSVSFSHQHQPEIYERIDQASILRQEQLMKPQSLQSASLDGGARQIDYLAARGAASRHTTQDLMSFGGRIDADARNSSLLNSSTYNGQHAPSILGAAPRRSVEDLLYPQSSSNPGYGVSLPPGRDYGTGKGLHGTSLESDYLSSHPRINERMDDRASYLREFELREEERRRELLRRGDLHDVILPSHEASHRRHSPVKEKRRDYVCKVGTSSLVDIERDYLSIDKRYPKLFASPEFSKVIVNWPKGNLKLSIHTPVSFEHDFVEDSNEAEKKELSTTFLSQKLGKPENGSTVWNAKIILLSGLSKNALEDLSSEKRYDDRVPHICNILRFAVLKRDRSFMAIGGPWDSADGGDPSVDDSALIQTALRHTKDVTQLDLRNCHNWNRFLEIHYDRFGIDGLFSHREVTVLFVPDLSECLPSLDAWREQWLAHKKAVADREYQLSLQKERATKKEGEKDKVTDSARDYKKSEQKENIKESASSVINKKDKDGNHIKGKATECGSGENDKKAEKKDEPETADEGKNVDKDQGGATGLQSAGTIKSGKIIRRIVKQKVTTKTADSENSISKKNELADEGVEGNSGRSEISLEQSESPADTSGVKTFVRKKVIRKVPVGKSTQNKENDLLSEIKAEKDCTEDKPKNTPVTSTPIVTQGTGIKTTIKKKIIKKVLKRKLTGAGASGGTGDPKKDDKKDEEKVVQAGIETENIGEKTAETGNQEQEAKDSEKKVIHNTKSKSPIAEKQASVPNFKKIKAVKEDELEIDQKSSSGTITEVKAGRLKAAPKDSANSKGGKLNDDEKSKEEKKKKDGKEEFRSKSNKEVKEKRKPEEPPRHPGFILRTKGNKESRPRFLSLSLDSLLDYTDKDVEESTFELSLFAESLYEMLQYQMGSRLLTFLQTIRINFVTKRNQYKRQRVEIDEKDKDKDTDNDTDKESSRKRLKTSELPVKAKSANSEMSSADQPNDEKTVMEDTSVDPISETKREEEIEAEEDPEEDPEECEEMEDPEEYVEMDDTGHVLSNEQKDEGKTSGDAERDEPLAGDEKDKAEEVAGDKTDINDVESNPKSGADLSENKHGMVKTEKKDLSGKEAVIDKEVLEAFRFFDRNGAGYIRVEDMRLIIHSLGKFLSHRDVKELVQSALLESNTGRDDRILYNKLVIMTGV
ncbi:hypothetical protein OIU77_013820 [Salix suchowensis]|uniref:EF-hand domain-containing protein n=1 Tax=Salix suchowensis TaxID=1278906 RepID=A0ABQ8ZWS8_9ROSI|nr:hypothetical protein OIU77_013820 [Salix suchowensis]